MVRFLATLTTREYAHLNKESGINWQEKTRARKSNHENLDEGIALGLRWR